MQNVKKAEAKKVTLENCHEVTRGMLDLLQNADESEASQVIAELLQLIHAQANERREHFMARAAAMDRLAHVSVK